MEAKHYFAFLSIGFAVVSFLTFDMGIVTLSGFCLALYFGAVGFEKTGAAVRLEEEAAKAAEVSAAEKSAKLDQIKKDLEQDFIAAKAECKRWGDALYNSSMRELQSELAIKKTFTYGGDRKEYLEFEYDSSISSFPRVLRQFIEPFREYALEQADSLAKAVTFNELTVSDKKFIVEKIEDEIDVLNRLCRQKQETLIREKIPLDYEFRVELKALKSLQKYHQYYISDIKSINDLGLSDLRERLYRKTIAEEEYNTLSGALFPVEHKLLYKRLSEDELLRKERNTPEEDDDYYE